MSNNKLKIIDLCGRLPYNVRVKVILTPDADVLEGYEYAKNLTASDIDELERGIIDNIMPYLRPMNSMTDEERSSYEWTMLHGSSSISDNIMLFDWLNAHHFDYRGLVSKGLALEAPKEMYKPKNQ